jgi:hypothetical protein
MPTTTGRMIVARRLRLRQAMPQRTASNQCLGFHARILDFMNVRAMMLPRPPIDAITDVGHFAP